LQKSPIAVRQFPEDARSKGIGSGRIVSILILLLFPLFGCRTVPPVAPDPYSGSGEERGTEAAAETVGDEIVICGQLFHTGAPVILWSDPGGYDAYDTRIRHGSSPDHADTESGRRYDPGRRERSGEREQLVAPDNRDIFELVRVVDQFILHFDVCGVSRTCFEVLHHGRGLSVHFLLDIDGTIYQTLDLQETCWHATKANPRSIGIEIAQIGAWPPGDSAALEQWYSTDTSGPYIDLPDRLGDGGVRTRGFVGRPARPERLAGTVNGSTLVQHDFTSEQYDSLGLLLDTLCRELPRIERRVPRDADGDVQMNVLSDREFAAFSGILGHYHVQANKTDPGPAFDWERLLRDLRN
jgi:N-acetylmuramoyl-L-alanine amidase